MEALEKEVESLRNESRETSIRLETLDVGVQGIVEEQISQRRMLTDFGMTMSRLTEAQTVDRIQLGRLERNTNEIIRMLKARTEGG